MINVDENATIQMLQNVWPSANDERETVPRVERMRADSVM